MMYAHLGASPLGNGTAAWSLGAEVVETPESSLSC